MCSKCLIERKELQDEIERVSKQAKDYAVKQKKLVIVYLDKGRAGFVEADDPKAHSIAPIKYLSYYQ